MNLDHVFKKTNKRFPLDGDKKPQVPEGLLCKCSKCGKTLLVEDVRKNYYVCPKWQQKTCWQISKDSLRNANDHMGRIYDDNTK